MGDDAAKPKKPVDGDPKESDKKGDKGTQNAVLEKASGSGRDEVTAATKAGFEIPNIDPLNKDPERVSALLQTLIKGKTPEQIAAMGITIGKDGKPHLGPEKVEAPPKIEQPQPKPADQPKPVSPEETAATLKALGGITGEDERKVVGKVVPIIAAALGQYEFVPHFDAAQFKTLMSTKNEAERAAVDAAFKTQYGKSLEDVARANLSGTDLADVLKVMQRKDGDVTSQRANDIGISLDTGASGWAFEKNIRDIYSTSTKAQIDQMDQDYRAAHPGQPGGLYDAVLADPKVSDATKAALKIYHSGADNRTPEESVALAQIGIDKKDIGMFQEAMAKASPEARAKFLQDGGAAKIQDAFGSTMYNEDGTSDQVSTADSRHAMDFAQFGKLSAATQIADNTGSIGMFTNQKGIELAINSMNDAERKMYMTGKQLAEHPGQPIDGLSDTDKTAAQNYYKELHDKISNAENSTNVLKLEDMIATKGGGFIASLADKRGMLWNSSEDDIQKSIMNMSQKDWQDLRSHPERRADVEAMLKTIKGDDDVKKLMAVYDAKMNPGAQQEQTLQAIQDMKPEDRQKYQQDQAFRTSYDEQVRATLGQGPGMDVAQHMLDQIKAGQAPSMDLADKLMTNALYEKNPEKAKADIDTALKDDPALAERLKHPKTQEDIAFAQRVQKSIDALQDPNSQNKMFDLSQDAGKKPILDSLKDAGPGFLSGGDANKTVAALKDMSQADQIKYREDPTFRQQVDQQIATNIKEPELLRATQRMMEQVKEGQLPKPDVVSNLLTNTDQNQAVRDMQKAFQDDPTLRDRINNPKTPADKQLSDDFKAAVQSRLGLIQGMDGTVIQDDKTAYADDLLKTGHIAIDKMTALDQGFFSAHADKLFDDLTHITPEEKQRLQTDTKYQDQVFVGLNDEQRKIAMHVVDQGALKPEDKIRMNVIGWGGGSDVANTVKAMKPDEMAAARAQYAAKYGGDFDNDILNKTGGQDKVDVKRALAGQLSFEEQEEAARKEGIQTRSGFGAWASDRVFGSATGSQADNAMEQMNAQYADYEVAVGKGLSDPKQIAELQERVRTAESQVQTALDNHRAAKEAAADTVVDVAVGVVGVGSVIVTGGVSLPLVAGLGLSMGFVKMGTKAAMMGEDYESGEAIKDFTTGVIAGATSVLGPAEVAAIFRVGSRAAEGAVMTTLENLGESGLKNALKPAAETELKAATETLVRNALTTGATGVEPEAIRAVADSAISSSITGAERQRLVAELSEKLQTNLASQWKEQSTGLLQAVKKHTIEQGFNAGAGVAGAGAMSVTQDLVDGKNPDQIAQDALYSSLVGGLSSLGMANAMKWGGKAIAHVRARGEGGVPEVEGQPRLEGPKTDGQPLLEGPRTDGQPLLEGPKVDGQPLLEGPRTDGQPLLEGPKVDGQPLLEGPRTDGQPVVKTEGDPRISSDGNGGEPRVAARDAGTEGDPRVRARDTDTDGGTTPREGERLPVEELRRTAAEIPPEGSHFSNEQMLSMWDKAVADNQGQPLSVVKGYYEAGVRQVDAAANPNGLILSSTESPMKLANDVTVKYSDGTSQTFKAGTELPNGMQISPAEVSVNGETRTITGGKLITTGPDGAVLKSGEIQGTAIVDKGQVAKPGQYVVSRPSVDPETGQARIDTYTNKDLSRWQPIEDKPGMFSPKIDKPVEVIKVPEGYQGTFDVSYGGTAPLKPGDLIVREDKVLEDGTKVPAFRRISQGDALETYRPTDAASARALDDSVNSLKEKYPEMRLTRAADSAEEFYRAASMPHRSNEEMLSMWNKAVADNQGQPLSVVKGYYEAGVRQVDAAANPNGLILSSTESPMKLANDVTVKYSDGTSQTFKAGTELPNGMQISPAEISVNGETSTITGGKLITTGPDGAVLKSGEIQGTAIVDKGQVAKPGQYIVSRPSVDLETGQARIDTYTNKDLSRWQPIEGKPGMFSPKIDKPVEVIKVPEGFQGTFDVSYGGTAPVKPGDLIVREDKTLADGTTVPAFRRISQGDALETYRPTDAASARALDDSVNSLKEKYPEMRLTRAADSAEEFYRAASMPHRSNEEMLSMWNKAVADNQGQPLSVVKGYYEAGVRQVDAAANPNGLILSSTESPMKLANDVTVKYSDGTSQTFKAGTELPNGMQISPAEVSVNGETSTITGGKLITTGPDGAVLKSGEIQGTAIVDKGQLAKPGQYIVSRPSVDLETGQVRIDTYTNKDLSRWQPIEGKPGMFSPKIDKPVEVIKVPEGFQGTFDVSYGGTAPVKPGDLIVREDKTLADGTTVPAFRRISQGDALETYRPTDAASARALDDSVNSLKEKYPEMRLTRAADSAEEFYRAASMPHRSNEEMLSMWNKAVADNQGQPLSVVKGYYEAGVRQVDVAANPNGLILSSTESPMKLANDVTVKYSDGTSQTFKAGTELPNGMQISPAEISVNGETSTITGGKLITTGPDGAVLKSGEIQGTAIVDKGQVAKPGQYIVSRPSVDLETGQARIDTYTNKDLSRWQPIEGKPGMFSPKIDKPVEVIKVPEGFQGTFDVSYGGTAPVKPGDLIVREDKTLADGTTVPAFRRISQGDALETYRPTDAASARALDDSVNSLKEKYPEMRLTRAADSAEEFYRAASMPHRSNEEMLSMWNKAVADNQGQPLSVVKGYYEAGVRQVDAAANPNGLILSSTESPMKLANDVTVKYSDGTSQTFKAGTELPNGMQISPAEISVNGETSTITGGKLITTGPDGAVLKSGEIQGTAIVDKGQVAKPGQYIVSRPSVDLETGQARIDTYTNKDLSRWQPIEGKPGMFSPKIDKPVEVIKVPEGFQGTFDVSYGGTAPVKPGDLIVREDKTLADGTTVPAFRRISQGDALETYRPTDAASARALDDSVNSLKEKYPEMRLARAADSAEEFYRAASMPHRSNEEMLSMWNKAVADNQGQPLSVVKGYYEAGVRQVDAAANPNGLILSSTESPMKLANDVTVKYSDGTSQTFKAGTELPNGMQISPAEISVNGETSTITGGKLITTGPDGAVLKSGEIQGTAIVDKGQVAKPGQYIVSRPSVDLETGQARIDTYTNKDLSRWQPIEGKPGMFSPKIDKPVEVIKVPEGFQGTFDVSYGGTAPVKPGDLIVREDKTLADGTTVPAFRRISQGDALETYRPTDAASARALDDSVNSLKEKYPEMRLTRAADSAEEFYRAASMPHRSNEEMLSMWNKAVADNQGQPLSVVKGYYEAGVRQVDAAANPNGLILSSTESPMKLANDVTVKYSDGTSQTFKAGTELPNGMQISPAEVSVNGETSTITGGKLITTGPDGAVLKSGEIQGTAIVDKGQVAKPGQYIVSRPSVDLETGQARIDTYTNKDLSRWQPIEGKPGMFSPKIDKPVEVIKVPEGFQGTFDVSYGGTAPVKPGDLIVREDKTLADGTKVPAFRRISQGDALETYRPTDAASAKAFDESVGALKEKYPDVKISRAAETSGEFKLNGEHTFRGSDGELYQFYPNGKLPPTTDSFEMATGKVKATLESEPFTYTDKNKNVVVSKPGEYRVTRDDGSVYAERPEILKALYNERPDSPGEFVLKPNIRAQQLLENSAMNSSIEGFQTAPKNSYLITGPNGEKTLLTADEFKERFNAKSIDAGTDFGYYLRTLPLKAEKGEVGKYFKNPDGAADAAPERINEGDMIAHPIGSEPYKIDAQYWNDHYLDLGNGEYARKDLTVAQVLDRPETTWSPTAGLTQGGPGDYLVNRPGGTQEIVPKAKFESQLGLFSKEPTQVDIARSSDTFTPEVLRPLGGDSAQPVHLSVSQALDESGRFPLGFNADLKTGELHFTFGHMGTGDAAGTMTEPIREIRDGLEIRVNGKRINALDDSGIVAGAPKQMEWVAPGQEGSSTIELKFYGKRIGLYSYNQDKNIMMRLDSSKNLSAFDIRSFHGVKNYGEVFKESGVVIDPTALPANQIDLHTHFAGSMRAQSIMEVAEKVKTPYPTELLDKAGIKYNADAIQMVDGKPTVTLEPKNFPPNELSKLQEKLSIPEEDVINFDGMESIYAFRTPLVKDLNAFPLYLNEIAKDYQKQGVRYAELSLSDVLKPEWLEAAKKSLPDIEKQTGVKLRFVVGMWRHSEHDYNEALVKKVIALGKEPYVVGVDFMGEETNSTLSFAPELRQLAAYRATRPEFQIRVHAGENPMNLENIKEAIKLGATRIGHGVYGVDKETLDLAKAHNVIIEFNTNSNLALSNIDGKNQLPAKEYLDAGVRITLGTDGHGLYQTSARSEEAVMRSLGLTQEDLAKITASDREYTDMMERATADPRVSDSSAVGAATRSTADSANDSLPRTPADSGAAIDAAPTPAPAASGELDALKQQLANIEVRNGGGPSVETLLSGAPLQAEQKDRIMQALADARARYTSDANDSAAQLKWEQAARKTALVAEIGQRFKLSGDELESAMLSSISSGTAADTIARQAIDTATRLKITEALSAAEAEEAYRTPPGVASALSGRGPGTGAQDARIDASLRSVRDEGRSALDAAAGRKDEIAGQLGENNPFVISLGQQLRSQRAQATRLDKLVSDRKAEVEKWIRSELGTANGAKLPSIPYWNSDLKYPNRGANESAWSSIDKIPAAQRTAEQQQFWTANEYGDLTPKQIEDYKFAQRIQARMAYELRGEAGQFED